MSNPEDTESVSEPPHSKTIGGRYEILDEIGSGGLSTVYRAKDLVLRRKVAIKLLKPQSSSQYIIRLQREAQAICQLKHPNIIEVYDFFMTDDNVPVLAMELINGEALDQFLKRNGPMTVSLACNVLLQICSAMDYAHRLQIMHRDLKPGNILLSGSDLEKPVVKVIDFGIAKQMNLDEGALTGAGVVLGTPSFISPEQASGAAIDNRSDIYSLGCLMYKCLTGKAPFRGSTAVDVISAQINEPAPSLIEGNPSLQFSDEIEEVVATALEKDPGQRFQSMNEFSKALTALVSDAVSADNVTPFTSTTPKGKFSWGALSVITLFLTLIGSIVYFIFQFDSTLEKDIARNDQLFDLRFKHHITTRHVQKWEWFVIEGTVTDEQLKILPQLNVKRLDLASSSITDKQLTYLLNLPSLQGLDLRGTKISDNGIETILKMRGLQTLLLERCPNVTSTGYRLLGNLKTLRILSLRDSNVSDEDLKYLSKLSNLLLLYVSDSPNISDAAIDEILKLDNLVSVRVGGTKVTTKGIDKLKDHLELIFLGLDNLNLSDVTMPKSFSTKITMLDLSKNPLSYRGLAGVLALKDLWYLDVRECPNISDEQDHLLAARFRPDEGRIILSDGPARGAFSDTRDEFYFNPEHYKESGQLNQVKLRRKLILDAIQGTSFDSEGNELEDRRPGN